MTLTKILITLFIIIFSMTLTSDILMPSHQSITQQSLIIILRLSCTMIPRTLIIPLRLSSTNRTLNTQVDITKLNIKHKCITLLYMSPMGVTLVSITKV